MPVRKEGSMAVVALILELLPPGGRVLDVGCGGGRMLRTLAERGVEGMGVDRYPYGGARCRRLRAEEISTLEERFDLVYTLHALHEFGAPEQFVREAKEVLVPGGALLIVDWVRGTKTGVRERYFAIETVAKWMSEAGFDIVRQEVRGPTMILAGRVPISGSGMG
jgi:2-polyprenyl-3-methyl-5-hydroxy-6-metoxy-1,4-benzoquinol methylase